MTEERFSALHGLTKTQPELDFIDINPQKDMALFIDPFAISIRNDDWSDACRTHIKDFFGTVISNIHNGNHAKAHRLLNRLSEPNETCLGLTKGRPSGRGVSGKQAFDLYMSLSRSHAAKTGILRDLEDCDLFVEGIGVDKISDITTNIIRKLLIEYTKAQCDLHGIPLTGTYSTGNYWDINRKEWVSDYDQMPVVNNRKIILVPKYSVRHKLCVDSQEYYNHHILNFIQMNEFENRSSLVRTLKSGEQRPPFKKTLKEIHPFSKDFLARFSEENPDIFENYKNIVKSIDGASGTLGNEDFESTISEEALAAAMSVKIRSISAGQSQANEFHNTMIGILEFIFWPNLIYPQKETPINQGRKRIDITYTNAALDGFFTDATKITIYHLKKSWLSAKITIATPGTRNWINYAVDLALIVAD